MTVVCTCDHEFTVDEEARRDTIFVVPDHHVPESTKAWLMINRRQRGVDWRMRCRMSGALVGISL